VSPPAHAAGEVEHALDAFKGQQCLVVERHRISRRAQLAAPTNEQRQAELCLDLAELAGSPVNQGPAMRYRSLLILFAAMALTRGVNAGAFPDKPLRLIVPFSAGAAADAVARPLAAKLMECRGQQVLVENRGGGRLHAAARRDVDDGDGALDGGQAAPRRAA
jgi:hypothetical protein